MFTDLYSLTTAVGGVTKLNGATIASSTAPIAAISATGTPSSTTFLRGDGTWSNVTGTGANPAGNANDVQYYATSTTFGGAAGIFSYNPSTGVLNLGGYNGTVSLAGSIIPAAPATATSAGLAMTVQGGPGGATSGVGGTVTVQGGSGVASAAGSARLLGGNSTSLVGGGVTIQGGQGATTGGTVNINAGTSLNGAGSAININAGGGAGTGGRGGAVTINGGSASGATLPGGSINLIPGINSATSNAGVKGGNIVLNAGASQGVGGAADNGLIQLYDGNANLVATGQNNTFVINNVLANQGCYQVTTGTSYPITHTAGTPDGCLIINGPTSMTITLPASPVDGEQVEVFNGGSGNINLTINANTGQTVQGGAITNSTWGTTGSSYKLQYYLAGTKWLRR